VITYNNIFTLSSKKLVTITLAVEAENILVAQEQFDSYCKQRLDGLDYENGVTDILEVKEAPVRFSYGDKVDFSDLIEVLVNGYEVAIDHAESGLRVYKTPSIDFEVVVEDTYLESKSRYYGFKTFLRQYEYVKNWVVIGRSI
jgi:hypothetical protein